MTIAEYNKAIPKVTVVKFLGLNYLVTDKKNNSIEIDGHSIVSIEELEIMSHEPPTDYFEVISLKNKIISDLKLLDVSEKKDVFSFLFSKSDSIKYDDLLDDLELYKNHVYQAFRRRSFLEGGQNACKSIFDLFFNGC